jgi:hypothetical protein
VKRLTLGIVGIGTALALLVPAAGNAAPKRSACVVVQAGNVNLQLGYAPNGPDGCVALP